MGGLIVTSGDQESAARASAATIEEDLVQISQAQLKLTEKGLRNAYAQGDDEENRLYTNFGSVENYGLHAAINPWTTDLSHDDWLEHNRVLIGSRSVPRYALDLTMPMYQTTVAYLEKLDAITQVGQVCAVDIDALPRFQWNGYVTCMLVTYNWTPYTMPTVRAHYLSLSSLPLTPANWQLNYTPLPATLMT